MLVITGTFTDGVMISHFKIKKTILSKCFSFKQMFHFPSCCVDEKKKKVNLSDWLYRHGN